MTYLNKTEAARQADVARSTIQAHIKSGKLSAVNGQIDTSELLRVYGELLPPLPPRKKRSTTPNTTPTAPSESRSKVKHELEIMRLKLEHSAVLLSIANQRADKAEAMNERLLEHKPAATSEQPPSAPVMPQAEQPVKKKRYKRSLFERILDF